MPPLSEADRTSIRRWLRDQHGRDGTPSALPGERDRNVHIAAADGDHLLKVMHAGCPRQLVELQVAALEHVARTAPTLPVPRVVRTRDGAALAELEFEGDRRLAWLVTFLPGTALAAVRPRPPRLLRDLGAALGALGRALADFDHPAARRDLQWDLRNAAWIGGELAAIRDPARRALAAAVHERYVAEWRAQLDRLPRRVIHGDGNDHNVLVAHAADGPRIAALIDFGDLCHSARVADCAIAAAYSAMGSDDPVAAIAELAAGFHAQQPLGDDELALLVPLVRTRLAVSVVNSALAARARPDDPYVTISEAPAWALLQQLDAVDARIADARVRAACGLEPWPAGAAVRAWLAQPGRAFAPVLDVATPLADALPLDLSFGSLLCGDDPERFDPRECGARIDAELRRRGASLGLGRYGEARPFYLGPGFGGDAANARRRTMHLGIDVFAPAGTRVLAPLPGEVATVRVCTDRLDYGGMVVLRHRTASGQPFATLYGHLDPRSVAALRPGAAMAAGQPFAALGAPPDNGDWPPHLHLQLVADDPAHGPDVPPGVAEPDAFAAHAALYPDPSPLLGLADDRAVCTAPPLAASRARRAAHFAANLKTSYTTPLALVRGSRHLLYDACGRRYLDAYNNVPHVGHADPHVAAAIAAQTRLLATNTRYLHELPLAYAERLLAHLPAPARATLTVCFFVNSGSEANELAVRLCRAHTGARDMLVMEHGYHGNTTGAMDLSPYKWPAAGGPDWVHATVQPDVYRGPHRGADAGARFAAMVAAQLADLRARGRRIAGYLSECWPSVGGQLELPAGFLAAVYAAVRAAGGLCVADDVQTALGRTGRHGFGFEYQAVVPDVLVLGKPLGNGFPLAAVVTTEPIAASFARGPEFFSTFGGNTVACAAGLAVLDVLERDGLQRQALAVGDRLLHGLRALQRDHAAVGDVRGSGLFLGVELVLDRATRAPAVAPARYVKERLCERRILIGTDGPHHNVLKIRPPMTFDGDAADLLLAELAAILGEDGAQAP